MEDLKGSVSAVVLAAGGSTRMGAPKNKVLLDLGGVSVLEHSLRVLHSLDEVAEIVLVVSPGDRDQYTGAFLEAVERLGVKKIVPGGTERSDSSAAGIQACSPHTPLLLIHDGARPYPPPSAVRQALRLAADRGAAILAVPLKDTLKRAGPAGEVIETVDRSSLYCAQTPQVFQRPLLEKAFARAEIQGVRPTDDAALVEAVGGKVILVKSDPSNLKITTPEDLALAQAIWQARQREGG